MPETPPGRAAAALLAALVLAGGHIAAPPAARAQDAPPTVAAPLEGPADARPVLVNTLVADGGYLFDGTDRGSQGVVYRLRRQTRAGERTLQLAYGADGAPRIARLVQRLTGDASVNRTVLTRAATDLAATVRPGWDGAEALETGIAEALAGSGSKPTTHPIATDDPQAPVVLRLYPPQTAAVVDIRPDAPHRAPLDRAAARALLRDTTARVTPADGAAYTAYHAPDGLLTIRPDGDGDGTRRTGSWRVAPGGAYCTETAPTAGWRCRYIATTDTGDTEDAGGHVLLRARDGRATGEVVAGVTLSPGNADDLFVARVRDVLDPEMVMALTPGHTVVRRGGGNGARPAVYYRADGTYVARRDSGVERGRWSVLQDGRRCHQPAQAATGAWRCAYLRETDGGTFALVDETGARTGEVVISEGNTEGL